MQQDKDKLRNADLEGIDRHVTAQNREVKSTFPGEDRKDYYPKKGRIVEDARGRRVIYDVVNGRPQITGYEGD